MTKPALWQLIAGELRAEIAAGGYAPGDRLPSEAELALRFGVNRHTIRHAVADLARVGEVRSRRGAGVFVAARRADYVLGKRVRFQQNLLASGRTPSRKLLRMETRRATQAEWQALEMAPSSEVHILEGLSLADGEPIAVFRSAFPASPFPGLLKALEMTNSVSAALAASGVGDYVRVSTRVTAEAADGVIAGHLALANGAPILRTVAVNADLNGALIEFGTTWFSGEKVTLSVSAPD